MSHVLASGSKALLVILPLAGASQLATARTWIVEKDGSGDFVVIQDAIDAAASGDIIQIGPGRFEEVHTLQLPTGTVRSHCRVFQDQLTIIGAGPDITIIGPANGPGVELDPDGITTHMTARLEVRDLTVENTSNGINANGPYVSLENCLFRNCDEGLDTLAWEGTLVQYCTFVGNEFGAVAYQGLGATNVLIEDCRFQGGLGGIDLQSQGSTVRNCQFTGQILGVQLSFGAQATIEGCSFGDMLSYGVVLTSGSFGTLTDNLFELCPINLNVQSDSRLMATGNIFNGGTLYTVRFTASTTISFTDNHVFNAGGWSAYFGAASVPTTFDVRYNWWGSTDAQQIDNWIRDTEDGATNVTVLFEPFHGMPISADPTSFGELKAKYGND